MGTRSLPDLGVSQSTAGIDVPSAGEIGEVGPRREERISHNADTVTSSSRALIRRRIVLLETAVPVSVAGVQFGGDTAGAQTTTVWCDSVCSQMRQ
jgi:hypothetical protein